MGYVTNVYTVKFAQVVKESYDWVLLRVWSFTCNAPYFALQQRNGSGHVMVDYAHSLKKMYDRYPWLKGNN